MIFQYFQLFCSNQASEPRTKAPQSRQTGTTSIVSCKEEWRFHFWWPSATATCHILVPEWTHDKTCAYVWCNNLFGKLLATLVRICPNVWILRVPRPIFGKPKVWRWITTSTNPKTKQCDQFILTMNYLESSIPAATLGGRWPYLTVCRNPKAIVNHDGDDAWCVTLARLRESDLFYSPLSFPSTWSSSLSLLLVRIW